MTGMATMQPPPAPGPVPTARPCPAALADHPVQSLAQTMPESPALTPAPGPDLPHAGHRRSDLPVPGAGAMPVAAPGASPGLRRLVTTIDRQLPDCRRRGRQLAVLVLAVDDIRGGDGQPVPALEERLMTEFGHRLRARVRSVDQVMWLGGREHGVILSNCPLEATAAVQQRLVQALGGVYRLETARVTVCCSVGAASYPAAGGNGEQLVAVAQQLRLAASARQQAGG